MNGKVLSLLLQNNSLVRESDNDRKFNSDSLSCFMYFSAASTSTPKVEFGCFKEVTFAMSSSTLSCPVPVVAFERMIIRDETEPAASDDIMI